MKKVLFSLIAALGIATGAHAAGGGMAWDKAPVNTTDKASLQNGAKLFVNYCLSCHSAAFMRYNRLKDIGLTDQEIKDKVAGLIGRHAERLRRQPKAGDLIRVRRLDGAVEPPQRRRRKLPDRLAAARRRGLAPAEPSRARPWLGARRIPASAERRRAERRRADDDEP